MSNPENNREQVKEWFSPLKVLNTERVNRHLDSLSKNGDNLVKIDSNKSDGGWEKMFGVCLSDVKDIPGKNVLEIVRRYRSDFQQKCDKTDDELNKLTKLEFVKLFADVMSKIFNEEEERRKEEELRRKEEEELRRQEEERKEELRRKEEERQEGVIEYDKNGCTQYEKYNTYLKQCLERHDGGSRKKYRKRSTRKLRRGRRKSTRKYKKSL
jgi:hypothetical protein